MDAVQHAKEVFDIEARAIAGLSDYLTADFEQAISYLAAGRGKVIVSGVGKSGLVAKKIAATLTSTGTPGFFLHPADAYHGDLGMVHPHDVVLILSFSGETDEILRLLPFLEENQNTIIAMCGNAQSTLVRCAHAFLNITIEKEACPLNLAPTSSTIAAMAMGDALAIALMKQKDFRAENFARFHPGGSLGRRLVTQVSQVMRKEALPTVQAGTHVKEIIYAISHSRLGLVVMLDEQDCISGIITDGDIRRTMESHEDSFFSLTAQDFATKSPKTIAPAEKLVEAERLMKRYKINTLLVAVAQKLVGVIQIYDIV